MPVYFIRWAALKGPIKIGWADEPEIRLNQIQAMSPVPLIILNTLDCDREQEGALHYHFAHLRLYGEWFKAKRELLRFVENPCRVIDRRPAAKIQSERRICIGYTGETALLPCHRTAEEGSDYCRRCNLKTPKGMPKVYLAYVEKVANYRPCQATTFYGKPCKVTAKIGDYCWRHRQLS